MSNAERPDNVEGIAIVGMSGRFPGANSVDAFWRGIKAGEESVTHFDLKDLEIDLADSADAPPMSDYVCAKGMLDNVEMFDARFFGYLPKEAEVMDPQHRLFLEICHEALEHGGCDPQRYEGAIGVYAGCYMDTYILNNLCADESFRRDLVNSIQVGTLQTELGNDKDYLATRVAFKLGLRGPAMTLQTACSTSLVAIATACQSLDAYQADMALAGGVTIVFPQYKGYYYKKGSMLSPDGHCRTFDENAAGTVFSNGAAVLLLKRLEDALAEGDTIYAVIKGYATNNDGGQKVSYTAPSVEGQSDVISMALGLAGFDPDTIGYVEAHGTATPLGDPIEINGLTTAYRRQTDRKQYCAIGSVKANLGHLDIASGAIGTIKTALSLHEGVLPPQINFTRPNPNIDFAASPFYVNTELKDWVADGHLRRAGVSSFGVGGTNAHLVLEEAPTVTDAKDGPKGYLLPLSAKTETALAAQAAQIADFLQQTSSISLADAAHTLQLGRKQYDHRRIAVGCTREGLIESLSKAAGPQQSGKARAAASPIVFMFPGQGAQYPGMGAELYEAEPVYRAVIDEAADALLSEDGFDTDIRDYLLWREGQSSLSFETASEHLSQTWLTQPAIFAVEIGLARLLESWGVTPQLAVGHSVGEFAAACHAGLFSLADGVRLVAARGRLIWGLPPGRMLAVRMGAEELRAMAPAGLSVAAVNGPAACVLSGPEDEISAFAHILADKDIQSTVLATSHAFHSSMMADAKAALEEKIAACVMHADLRFTIVSTATGEAVSSQVLSDPGYWGDQLMQPVLFHDALTQAVIGEDKLCVEVGPGQALGAFARQAIEGDARKDIFSVLGPTRDPGSDVEHALRLVGALWTRGCAPDWSAINGEGRRKIALPTYPFERKRFWVDPPHKAEAVTPPNIPPVTAKKTDAPQAATAAPSDDVEQLIFEQLKLVQEQLKIMQG